MGQARSNSPLAGKGTWQSLPARPRERALSGGARARETEGWSFLPVQMKSDAEHRFQCVIRCVSVRESKNVDPFLDQGFYCVIDK